MRRINHNTILSAPSSKSAVSPPSLRLPRSVARRETICARSGAMLAHTPARLRMKSYQILAAISPDLQKEVMNYLHKEAKEAFRTSLYQVGAQRKLRPQYFQRKTPTEQEAWLLGALKLKIYDGVTEQILQLWLLKAKEKMIVSFLDAAGIKHDGKGQVDDLPESLDTKQVKAGIDVMLKEHPAEHVSLYLHVFQLQQKDGWPAVAEALEKTDELKLGAPSA